MTVDIGVFRVTATISDVLVGGSTRHRAVAHIGIVEPDGVISVWDEARGAPEWDRGPVWFHGDLPGNLIARNRYRIFGKYDECFVPDADMRARVLE